MGVWVGGEKKGPLIFLTFSYVYTLGVLITNIVSKAVNDFCMGLNFYLKLGIRVHHFCNYPVYVAFEFRIQNFVILPRIMEFFMTEIPLTLVNEN